MIEKGWMDLFILLFFLYSIVIAWLMIGIGLEKRQFRKRRKEYNNFIDELEIPDGMQVELIGDQKKKR